MSDTTQLKEKTKTLTLLYVEDDAHSREQLGMILKILFKSITIAKDGAKAWELYKEERFDLVITDINMPHMNGIELLQKIKGMNATQKVIIASAHDTSEYFLSAIREGVDSFILKPIEMKQFMNAVENIAILIHHEKLQSLYLNNLESEVANKTRDLLQQTMTDELTGLYNRKRLNMLLQQRGEKVIMLLNIDNFDNINATYGYDSGDLILQQIAHFLDKNRHQDATLFRLGYDEFIFLFLDEEWTEATEYAKEVQRLIRAHPINHEDIIVKFSATIVLAKGEFELLKDVHVAFKMTRALGKNRIGFYQANSEIEAKQIRIQNYMHTLNDVLEHRNIVPFFQAIVNNKTLEIEKYECLARIFHDGKMLLPTLFLETAELSGMIPELTKIMIEKSFSYFENRVEEFSINISESDLNEEYLVEHLADQCEKYNVLPQRVVIEVLEGISSRGVNNSFKQLELLKERGFQLAIDDFGAENSNFERVYNLKVDYIKIDGQFIKNIDTDINSYNVAKAITEFAKSIGAKVIAEHVHSEAIQKKVMDLGIDYTQGFYFSEPSEHI